MRALLKYIICILLIFIFAKIEGQENSLEHYHLYKDVLNSSQTKTYLSSNIVTAIAQDQYGMLWFGTKRGLNSFDSYAFEEYNQNQGIINATISSISPVGDTLFVGTVKGLSVYDLKTRECTNYFAETDSLVLPDNNITFISQPIKNKIVICTKGGTSVYNLKTRDFEIIKIENYSPKYEINSIEYMPYDDSWWAATSDGLVNFSYENQSIKHYYHVKGMENSIPDNVINCICTIDSKNVFIGTQNGLCILNAEDKTFRRVNLNELANYQSYKIDISKIIPFSEDEIMISTRGDGIFLYNYVKESVISISKLNKRYTISENHVFDIYKDSKGTVWIATFTGLNKLEKKLTNFSTIQFSKEKSILAVTYFLEMPNDNVLVGTESGIKIFNINDLSSTDFDKYYDIDDDVFDSLYIYSFYYDDKDSSLWVGTRNDGFYKYDFEKKTIIDVADYYKINNLKYAVVREMMRDKDDNFWVATNIGLCCINLKTEEVKFYRNDKNDLSSIPNDDIYDLISADTVIYITTGDGLAVYDYEKDNFTTFRVPDSLTKDNVVKNNGLYDIVLGHDGRYYIGSYSCGLVAFNPRTEEIKIAIPKGSFSSTMVYSIIPDRTGELWVSTNKGITKYNIGTKEAMTYDASDGLQANEFTPNAFLNHSDGLIFFGGFNGFSYFNPDDIYIETTNPKMIITSLRTNNDKHYRYFTHGDTLHLTYKDNSFEIQFATINLLRKNMITYTYMLENYDKEWTVHNSTHRYADYNQIRPGTYIFKLNASNETKVWSENPLELTIIIHPAWYQTILFKITIIVVLILAIYIIIKQRSKIILQKREQKRKINELEIQMNQLKQKTLQLQMNPHVIFNTLNSIQQYIINNDIDNAVRYLSSFSKLMRRILNNSNERFIPLSDELDAIRLYLELESMRLGNRFSYSIDIDSEIDEKDIEIAPLLIQPFVENAIIHGLMPKKSNSHLKIVLSKIASDKLICIIEDNGVGRDSSMRSKMESGSVHKSYGMSITKRRLEMLSKISNDDFSVEIVDLYDDLGDPAGTRVNIIISYQE